MTSGPVIEYCASDAIFFQNPPSEKTFLREIFLFTLGFALHRDKNTISPKNIFEPQGVLQRLVIFILLRLQGGHLWIAYSNVCVFTIVLIVFL